MPGLALLEKVLGWLPASESGIRRLGWLTTPALLNLLKHYILPRVAEEQWASITKVSFQAHHHIRASRNGTSDMQAL